VWLKTRGQRWWVHKTANVLARLPKSQQPNAKRELQEIWMAETTPKPSLRCDCQRFITGARTSKLVG
jgi:hypothetical protein